MVTRAPRLDELARDRLCVARGEEGQKTGNKVMSPQSQEERISRKRTADKTPHWAWTWCSGSSGGDIIREISVGKWGWKLYLYGLKSEMEVNKEPKYGL